jgi:hypothetical protein
MRTIFSGDTPDTDGEQPVGVTISAARRTGRGESSPLSQRRRCAERARAEARTLSGKTAVNSRESPFDASGASAGPQPRQQAGRPQQRPVRPPPRQRRVCRCPKLRAVLLTWCSRSKLRRHDRPVALNLTYQMFAKLLSWMVAVLQPKRSRFSSCVINWQFYSAANRGHGSTGPIEPCSPPSADSCPLAAAADCWSHPRRSCAGTDTSSDTAGPPRTPAPADPPSPPASAL